MFLKTFFKFFIITGIAAGGITSAVVFSNISNDTSPFLRVLSKDSYMKIKKQQGFDEESTNAAVRIDYASLSTSTTNFSDLLMDKNVNTNAFIITVGSQAYAQTNNILAGQSKSWAEYNPNHVSSSSLMLRLYELFYNTNSEHHKAVEDFNATFYSFVDVLNAKDVIEAANLFQYRKTKLGVNQDKEADGSLPIGVSNVWNVKNPDTNISEQQPVVKTSSSSTSTPLYFNYEPTTDYYEFRPNDGYETKYEKVYFRNQENVSLFNSTINWANSYASSYLSGFNISNQGSVILAKKVEGVWSFTSVSPSSQTASDDAFKTILKFYNSKYNYETGEVEEETTTQNVSHNTLLKSPTFSKESEFIKQIENAKINIKYKKD